MAEAALAKARLRDLARARRLALTDHQRETHSAAIRERLRGYLRTRHPEVRQLLCYRATGSEVDTTPLFSDPAWRMHAPVTPRRDRMDWLACDGATHWVRGFFGVPEPEDGAPWRPQAGPSLLVCPLLAFDRQGHRLGMGKGCFDQWLVSHRDRLRAVVGLAFACQELDRVPVEAHDAPLDAIITEKEVIIP
ncbi:MAG: 5-formyltetrahydrofolate cyclo-ligase [Mariprofundaceae bacterium]